MPLPDLRMASTIEKLDCSVFNAATAAWIGCESWTRHERLAGKAYTVVTLHYGRLVEATLGRRRMTWYAQQSWRAQHYRMFMMMLMTIDQNLLFELY